MHPNPYEAPASANVVRPDTPRRATGSPVTPSSRFKAALLALGVWQLACLAMMYVCGYAIDRLVVVAYTLIYGDIQASYGRFARITTYVGLFVVTLPASVVTIAVIDKLSAGKGTRRRKTLAVGCWQLVTMVILGVSYEIGFPYMINQLGWRLFGPPADIYSFQNLLLSQLIAWLLCTTPIVCLTAWTYSRLCEFRRVHQTPGD